MNTRITAVLPMLALVLLLIITPSTTIVFARHHGGGSSNSGAADTYAKGLDAGTSAAQSDNPDFDNTKSVSDCMNQGTTYTVAYCQGFVKGYYDTENSLISGGSGSPSSPSPPNEQFPQQTGPSNINPGGGNGGSLITKLCNSINSHPTLALALGHLLGLGSIGPAAAQAYCGIRSR